jgi:hypothetical protein
MSFKIQWFDHGREPKCPPDPRFPDGKDLIDGTLIGKSCRVDLPYPAKRCGHYVVECETCGLRVGFTTAGRPDDPRSATLACLPHA